MGTRDESHQNCEPGLPLNHRNRRASHLSVEGDNSIQTGMTDSRNFWTQVLGPGLLFAGAAVGVSHLVQATSAGVLFGLGMIWLVILANAMKMPAFIFATRYTIATSQSVLMGYKNLGKPVLTGYIVITCATMLIVQGAVTITTAGLVNALLVGSGGPTINIYLTCGLLLTICVLILLAGGYGWLDQCIKMIVVIFTGTTLLATVVVLAKLDYSALPTFSSPFDWNGAQLIFICGLAGWMPAPLDLAAWNSQWTISKIEETGYRPTTKESELDFKVGYLGAAILAVCFVVLGSWAYGDSIQGLSPVAFATKIIAIYGETLGTWAKYVVGTSAVAVMFSTTITVLDGFPRALAGAIGAHTRNNPGSKYNQRKYIVITVVLAVGTLLFLKLVIPPYGFKPFINFATAIALVTSPIFAIVHHQLMLSPEMPEDEKPPKWLLAANSLAIAAMLLLATVWLYVKLF